VSLAVVVPTVGRIGPLRRLLLSVAVQTVTPDALLIVDQNPAGFLDALLREFPSAVRVGLDEANLAAARNVGFAATSSTHVLFLDDDEVIDPDFVERVMATFARHPEVRCLWPVVHGPGARAAGVGHWRRLADGPLIAGTTLFRIRRIAGGGAVFESEFFRATGGYDETLYRAAHMAEDWELSARMRRRGMPMWCDASLFLLHDPANDGGCETRALPLAEARRRVVLSTALAGPMRAVMRCFIRCACCHLSCGYGARAAASWRETRSVTPITAPSITSARGSAMADCFQARRDRGALTRDDCLETFLAKL